MTTTIANTKYAWEGLQLKELPFQPEDSLEIAESEDTEINVWVGRTQYWRMVSSYTVAVSMRAHIMRSGFVVRRDGEEVFSPPSVISRIDIRSREISGSNGWEART